MAQEGERVYMEKDGAVVWGTVLGELDDGRLIIAWDDGNPLGLDASFGIQPEHIELQTLEAA